MEVDDLTFHFQTLTLGENLLKLARYYMIKRKAVTW